MRFGRLFPALSVFVAAGALIVLTGTGAAAPQPGRSAPAAITANLAAPAALDATLRSLGVNRASLVTQRGARNYAGPNCPGKGWNCTTSTRVLQIAKGDGQNKVDCLAGSIDPPTVPPSQSCTITQTGPNNVAKCQQRSNSSAAIQHCSITQTGKRNIAYIDQSVHAHGSDLQSATQTAVVDQTSTGHGGNKSFVDQSVKQSTQGDGEHDEDEDEDEDEDDDDDDGPAPSALQMQDAEQTALVTQMAAGSGDNYSRVHQSQRLSAKNALEQYQNTLEDFDDCVSGFPFSPNGCASIDQSAVNGDNASHLKQSIRESAKTNAVAVQQTQGSFSGGLDGRVHQVIAPLGDGTSKSKADQSKRQNMVAAPDTPDEVQDQFDPLRCCGVSSQVGGSDNSEQIDQSSTQAASEEFAFQELALLGESFSPSGSCSVSQQASNNSDSTPNSGEADPCDPPLVVLTTCTNGSESGSCTPNPDGCSPFCDIDFSELAFAKPNG